MRMPPLVGYDSNYEQMESDLLARILRLDTTAIDIGAHTGHYTLLAARHVGSAGKVLAVEPDPTNLVDLCHNVGANGFRQVQILSAAVSSEQGTVPLYLDGSHGGDNRLRLYPGESRNSLLVNCVTLDQLVELAGPRVEFVKIDVQGNEIAVLEGGKQFLEEQKDLLMLVEYSPFDLKMSGGSGPELLEKLFGHGFMILAANVARGGWTPLSPETKVFAGPEEEKRVCNLLCLRGSYQGIVGK